MVSWVRLPITGGSVVIDLADLPIYASRKWHLGDTGYAVNRSGSPRVTTRLHRLIAETPSDLVTDHINHNRLDNRRHNLRVCTQESNMRNSIGRKGYCWDESKQKWMVRYRDTFYGRYDTEAEAIRAYKLAQSGVPYQKRERREKYHLPTGVFKNRTNRGYQAKVQIDGQRVYLGTFPTAAEAEQAYITAKKERIVS